MPEENARGDDFEVYCVYCNKALTDEDEVHFICGPYGYDIDVMCGDCLARSRQAQTAAPGLGLSDALGLGGSGDPFDLLAGAELPDGTGT